VVNVIELIKAHYTAGGLKKDIGTIVSGDCLCGFHDSLIAHHFTLRGDIIKLFELRGDNVWGKEDALGLSAGFFEKHNKNIKKRKASDLDDDDAAPTKTIHSRPTASVSLHHDFRQKSDR
jgi:hypothetical protein